jgi:hypothetical protein
LPKNFTLNAWNHLAIAYDMPSLTTSVFVNGVLSASAGGQVQVRNVTRTSNYFGYSGTYVNMMYDEIKFHGRALTAQEVLNDFNYNNSYITFTWNQKQISFKSIFI